MAAILAIAAERSRGISRCRDGGSPRSSWSERYGEKHRLKRIKGFPAGIQGPQKVRISSRAQHYILQWWDKAQKRNLCERVDGDLVAAILRARQVEERLEHFRGSGLGVRKISHVALIESYLADLASRADAGEIDPRTVRRYSSALAHFRDFAELPDTRRRFAHASSANREMALGFLAYLKNLAVAPNGHRNSQRRPMRSAYYVNDVVRSAYEWAADPLRGNLLPEGFRNPFAHTRRQGPLAGKALIGEPDITLAMAEVFLEACDPYQLRLFASLAIYGLRAAEPCFLFHEHMDEQWLRVQCLPQLDYQTKGRLNKNLPLIDCIASLLHPHPGMPSNGLIYLRRAVMVGSEVPPLLGTTVNELGREFQERCTAAGASTAALRLCIRDSVLRAAGAITYDHIVGEFRCVARRLNWPQSATIKDLRHLAATCFENEGVPEHYKKHLLGQSPGRAAIVSYTHLNRLPQHFERLARGELRPLFDVIRRQHARFSGASGPPSDGVR